MIINKQIDGIWHTSVVVYGKEFYFSGGICFDNPKTTAFGQPVKEIKFGETEISPNDFHIYLQSIKNQFKFETYHIFENNCNHFTNAILEFLCGKTLHDEILNQHKHLENTPIGKMIEGMQVNLNNNRNGYNLNNL